MNLPTRSPLAPVTERKPTLVEDFQNYFTLELATTPEQMEAIWRIRYRVYCEEFGYEAAEAFPDQLEADDFDSHSAHCLITHNSSKMPAACVRLVEVDNTRLMPMEHYCADAIERGVLDSFSNQRATLCEFSRLAVDGAFRRRAGERATRFGEISSLDITQREQRTFSLIAVSTFTAAFALSDVLGRTNVFAMMEPFLPRLLRRSGILVNKVGSDIDYHGLRAPYFMTTDAAADGMKDDLKALYRDIRGEFAQTSLASRTR